MTTKNERGPASPYVIGEPICKEIDTAVHSLYYRLKARARSHRKPGSGDKNFFGGRRGADLENEDDCPEDLRDFLVGRARLPRRLVLLAERYHLSRFEAEVLLLCIATEIDTSIGPLCALAMDDPTRPYPTFALALTLFRRDQAEQEVEDDYGWEALSPVRPLRRYGLVLINQPDMQPLLRAGLRASERVTNFVKGLDIRDHHIDTLWEPLPPPEDGWDYLLPSEQAEVETARAVLDHNNDHSALHVFGDNADAQRALIALAAQENYLPAYRLPLEGLTLTPAESETLLRRLEAEAILDPFILAIDAHNGLPAALEGATSSPVPLLRRLMDLPCPVALLAPEAPAGLATPAVTLAFGPPAPEEQQAAWKTALQNAAPTLPDAEASRIAAELAGQFRLGASAIRQIAARTGEGSPDAIRDRLWEACRERTRPRMDGLAQRITPVADWKALVLPRDEEDTLHQIVAQTRHRYTVYFGDWKMGGGRPQGLGISALFHGESGTGKTLAAEVVAHELGLDLYRIDLSAVVSKYIGETEKNLKRLFDAAEEGGALLFFDEADALFGKRSAVKDSHDRYANIEINYLLQRIEAYTGLAILATNRKGDLDLAFLRRLRFIVAFPFPEPPERTRIWEIALPTRVRDPHTDWPQVITDLANLPASGGEVRNIALNAAFRAAASVPPSQVTVAHLRAAAKAEFRKAERPLDDSDLPPDRPLATPAVANNDAEDDQ